MDRRDFLHLGGAAAAGLGLAACSGKADDDDDAGGAAGDTGGAGATTGTAATSASDVVVEVAGDPDLPEIEWEMPTSWPANLDTIYGGAVVFAEAVAALSGNRFRITPRPAGELVPPLEVLQNVQSGAFPIGHTASYYYTGLAELTAFGTSLPFGLNARQQNAWLYEGGALELLQGMYADRFNAIQFPAGNTGCQMGGWFNTEIGSVGDLSGLKMRIPGLGGRIMDASACPCSRSPAGRSTRRCRPVPSTPPSGWDRMTTSTSGSPRWPPTTTTPAGGSRARRSRCRSA